MNEEEDGETNKTYFASYDPTKHFDMAIYPTDQAFEHNFTR